MAYRKGDELKKLTNYVNDLQVLVLVYDLKTDTLVREKRINYGNPEDRQWIGKMSFWAFTNHCSVETYAISDIDLATEKVTNEI